MIAKDTTARRGRLCEIRNTNKSHETDHGQVTSHSLFQLPLSVTVITIMAKANRKTTTTRDNPLTRAAKALKTQGQQSATPQRRTSNKTHANATNHDPNEQATSNRRSSRQKNVSDGLAATAHKIIGSASNEPDINVPPAKRKTNAKETGSATARRGTAATIGNKRTGEVQDHGSLPNDVHGGVPAEAEELEPIAKKPRGRSAVSTKGGNRVPLKGKGGGAAEENIVRQENKSGRAVADKTNKGGKAAGKTNATAGGKRGHKDVGRSQRTAAVYEDVQSDTPKDSHELRDLRRQLEEEKGGLSYHSSMIIWHL